MNHGASASTTEEIASGQTAVRTEAEIVQLALAARMDNLALLGERPTEATRSKVAELLGTVGACSSRPTACCCRP